eukprot:8407914-Pyramimonas_sp.AAC.1
MVESGYRKFSPTLAGMFTEMVNEKRIDVPAENGKRGGAYCASAFGCGPFQVSEMRRLSQDVSNLAVCLLRLANCNYPSAAPHLQPPFWCHSSQPPTLVPLMGH